MKKTIATVLSASILAINISSVFAVDTDYKQKLPYQFKEPNWEKYTHGQQFGWPLPAEPGYSTGLYSMASANEIDFKEDENNFFKEAAKYKSSDTLEVYYKSNPASSVRLDLPENGTLTAVNGGGSDLQLKLPDTNVSAYNNAVSLDELILEPAQGQWLVTNGYYSRDSSRDIKPVKSVVNGQETTVIDAGVLNPNPWGVMGNSTPILTEDFLMQLSKSIYGTIQSRAAYMQSTPFRLARKVTWRVSTPPEDEYGYCSDPTSTYLLGDWIVQNVSIGEHRGRTISKPGCGETRIIDRGEYIVHPDGYLNNVYMRYHNDQNSFVSPNVYELYFTKLLQKGILDTSSTFANVGSIEGFSGGKSSSFSFAKDFAEQFFSEYHNYGQNDISTSSYFYPPWAPELGALYSNSDLINTEFGKNITDSNITINKTWRGDERNYSYALGRRYVVNGDSQNGVTSISLRSPKIQLMEKQSVVIIDALRLIEKALRIEDGDITTIEADIITKKYGAKYLNTLTDADRNTVKYLLAKGILNFEKFQEYSNLYSTLNVSFAYKLLYRVANKSARAEFKKVNLTDSSATFGDFLQYQDSIARPVLSRLINSGSVTATGSLIKDGTGEPLTLSSDVIFAQPFDFDKKDNLYKIQASLDDISKYIYQNKPLVNVLSDGSPKPLDDLGNFEIFEDESSANSNTGIISVKKNKSTNRWDVVFSVNGVSKQSSEEFILANLKTRTSSVTQVVKPTSVAVGSSVLTKQENLDSAALRSKGDILVNTNYGLSSYSNDTVSLSGNYIIPGPAAVNIGDQVFSSRDIYSKLSPTIHEDSVGTKEVIDQDISQLRRSPIDVYSNSGVRLGSTDFISDSIDSTVSMFNDTDSLVTGSINAYSLSSFRKADVLISDRVLTYSSLNSELGIVEKNKINATVIVSWDLNLPSELEQNSLVGTNITPYTNDNAKASWLFTAPENTDLLSLWNYNTGLNNAILKAYGGDSSDLTIASGYFSPSIDILVSSLNSRVEFSDNTVINLDLSESQQKEIKNSILNEIGAKLDPNWISTYIGDSSLTTFIVPDSESVLYTGKELTASVTSRVVESDNSGILFSLNTALGNKKIPIGEMVWGSLAFNRTAATESSDTYLKKHNNVSKLNLYTIYTTKFGNHYYGDFYAGGGEGAEPNIRISYVKDNFDNVYRSVESSDFLLDESAGVLREKFSQSHSDSTGSTINFGGLEWYVVKETDSTLQLITRNFIQSVYQGGNLFTVGSSSSTQRPILEGIASVIDSRFGVEHEKGIDARAYYNLSAFDFVPNSSDIDSNLVFGAIQAGVLGTFQYKTAVAADGTTSKRIEVANIKDGDLISVPAFVTISKNVWSVRNNELVWSKKFSGANAGLYNRGSLVQSIKEQILHSDSKNILASEDIKTGTLEVGTLAGSINGDEVVFLVPFSTDMLVGNRINYDAVIDKFNEYGDVVLVDNSVSSSTQFFTNKKVGEYDAGFKGYNNTLVNLNGKLGVATGNSVTEYVEGLVVSSISLKAVLLQGVKILDTGLSNSDTGYTIFSRQLIKPAVSVSPFASGALPTVRASTSVLNETATAFSSFSGGERVMKSLETYIWELRAKSVWYKIIVGLLGLSLLLSVLTLFAHIFSFTPLTAIISSKLLDMTGLDILSLMSIGTVRTEQENNWVRTVRASVILGVSPLVLFGVMRIYGFL